MFKIKVKSLVEPSNYIGVSYRYKSGAGSTRTIKEYDKKEKKFWTNAGTYIELDTFLDHLKSGYIVLD